MFSLIVYVTVFKLYLILVGDDISEEFIKNLFVSVLWLSLLFHESFLNKLYFLKWKILNHSTLTLLHWLFLNFSKNMIRLTVSDPTCKNLKFLILPAQYQQWQTPEFNVKYSTSIHLWIEEEKLSSKKMWQTAR